MKQWIREDWSIDRLKEWDANPRKRNPKQYAQLVESIKKFGLSQAIIVNTDGTIIGGHQRTSAAKEAGLKIVPVMIPKKKLTKDEMKELNVRLNKNIAGEWDRDVLKELFGDPEDLAAIGFDDWELKDWIDDDVSPDLTPPADFNPPRASSVRMVQLYLDDETHDPFLKQARDLFEFFEVDNVTDAVRKAVEYAHKEIIV